MNRALASDFLTVLFGKPSVHVIFFDRGTYAGRDGGQEAANMARHQG